MHAVTAWPAFLFVVAEAATKLTWTAETFYALTAGVHVIAILLAFRVLGIDSEANTFIGAVIAAAVANAAAFFLRDTGVLGVLGIGGVTFIMLVIVSSMDMVRSAVTWAIVVALWGGVAWGVLPRAPGLKLDDLGGMPRVVLSGGMEAEPMTDEEGKGLLQGKPTHTKR